MSKRNHAQTTINIRPVNHGVTESWKFYRTRKQMPRRPYYKKDVDHNRVMLSERMVEEQDVRAAKNNKLPQYELISNNVTRDYSRRKGYIFAQLERMQSGLILEVLPTGHKRVVATRRRGVTSLVH